VDSERFETLNVDKDHNKAALLAVFKVSVRAICVRISYNGERWDRTAL